MTSIQDQPTQTADCQGGAVLDAHPVATPTTFGRTLHLDLLEESLMANSDVLGRRGGAWSGGHATCGPTGVDHSKSR